MSAYIKNNIIYNCQKTEKTQKFENQVVSGKVAPL